MMVKMNLNKSRNSYSADYTLVDVYKKAKQELSLKSDFFEVDKKKFMSICTSFNNKLIEQEVLGQPLGAKLPHSLGEIRIKKIMPRPGAYSIDHNLSKKYKKKIVHFNEHTNGAICIISWFNNSVKLKGRSRYSFKSVRNHSRNLCTILKNPDREVDYFE